MATLLREEEVILAWWDLLEQIMVLSSGEVLAVIRHLFGVQVGEHLSRHAPGR